MSHNLKYLYGPVFSWRLGRSLGLDLISTKEKICNFDCKYCQIERTSQNSFIKNRSVFVKTEDIMNELNVFFDENKNMRIDFMTFSGRGEPTLAKNLGEVISKIKNQSNKNIRNQKLALITNSSLLNDKQLQQEIKDLDVIIAKFNVCDEKYLKQINNPADSIKFDEIFEGLKNFRKIFNGQLELQVMFVKENKHNYENIFDLIKQIKPNTIHINTPLRPCEVQPLSKDEIDEIKSKFENYFKTIKDLKISSVYDIKKEKIEPINKKNTISRRGKE